MSKVTLIARLIFGVIFLAAGLAGLLNLAPPPADMPENMKTYMAGMMVTQYFFPLLKGTEAVCGLLILSGRLVPLALIVLAPIVLNIFLVHAFMEPSGLVTASVLVALEIYLSFFSREYSPAIKSLFRVRATSSAV